MSPEKVKGPSLNVREGKIVQLALRRVQIYISSGKQPQQFLIKVEPYLEMVNIQNVAQALHLEGIGLEEYFYSEENKGHVFRPMPYEKPARQGYVDHSGVKKATQDYQDLLNKLGKDYGPFGLEDL
ncbi:hypothetical protein HY502_02100 [Candidatus Woesebacteria bacterium]|nr:hypothetical protein [Candidatus Woesebacteria bacterium]